MSSFKKKCTFCNQEIQLTNDSGRWLPRNLDNTAHECKNRGDNKSTQSQVAQTQPQTQSQTQPQPQPQSQSKQVLEQHEQIEKGIWAVLEDFNKRLKKLEYTLYGMESKQ